MRVLRAMAAVSVVAVAAVGVPVLTAPVAPAPAAAAAGLSMPDTTLTRYEHDADPWVAFQQGASDGKAGLAGLAILDFGRPAADATGAPATLDFGSNIDTLPALVTAAERYADGYRINAPAGSKMYVLIGTNDSCGTGQPCGSTTCGCPNEPSSYLDWGKAWGQAVGQLDAYLTSTASAYQSVAVSGAADDAEPGFDPGYINTYDTLSGYADVTGRPMIDYGSLDGGPGSSFWTAQQMYQVAYGFKPDAPLPEVYYPHMADQWAALSHWAAANAGGAMKIFGVLTEYPSGYSPAQGYQTLLAALRNDYADTGQASLQWSSNVGSTPVLADPPALSRVAGSDRDATSVAVSQAAFPADRSAKVAVLATSDSYPDALVGGPLAAAEGGPLLLTSSTTLDPAVQAELQRVLPAGSTVYLLGGLTALSAVVQGQVTAAGFTPRRIAGLDRYGTAVGVAQAMGDPATVLVASGADFPDALVAGAAAAHLGGAVLLSSGSAPAAATTAYLASRPTARTYAIGGPAGTAYPSAQRIAGPDRYQTAASVASRLVPGAAGAGLASGSSFPDGLVAAPLLARKGWPLLLAAAAYVPAGTTGYLSSGNLSALTVVGGPTSVTQGAAYQARYVSAAG
ncbi:MAG TPA: cell wall-binding repeat-containing protein [Acidimicrobiales bacterium]|nr:cell wall-binding repeat-containing protein [Acidimicrobiales bacterium]